MRRTDSNAALAGSILIMGCCMSCFSADTTNRSVRLMGAVSTLESFCYESDAPPGVARPKREVANGMKLVALKADLVIPRGWSWDLSTVQLETETGKRYTLLALRFGDNLHIRAAEGGHATVNEDATLSQIRIIGMPGKTNHLGFVDREWPGARHEFEFVFEVPKAEAPKTFWAGAQHCDIAQRPGGP